MKLQLPFFPEGTKLINETLGFRELDGTVYYYHNGTLIFSHSANDPDSSRFILANLIVNKLCKVHELSKATQTSYTFIKYYAKALQEQGAAYFFRPKTRVGHCPTMTQEKMALIQQDLVEGISVYRIARNHNISESVINYHIRNGNLKKKKSLKTTIS